MKPAWSSIACFVLWFALATAPASQLAAQNTVGIVAVVNEEAITAYDVEQRIGLLIVTSGLDNTADQRERLRPRVLQTLIDERLKSQEIERSGITLTEEEFGFAVQNLEQANNVDPGELEAFFTRLGVSLDLIVSQIRIDVSWQKLLADTDLANILIDQTQVDEAMARIEASEGQTEFRLLEILLLADERAGVTMEDVRDLASRLIDQIRNGSSFGAIAVQFSDSPSAASGGVLGWQLESELNPVFASAVRNLGVGSITRPLEEERGFRILALAERRLANSIVNNDTRVSVRQLFIPVPAGSSEAQIETKASLAEDIRESATSCDDFKRRAAAAGTPQSPQPTQLRLGDINPVLRGILAGLAAGSISEPLRSNLGIQMVMMCARETQSNLPSREVIRNNLTQERINTISQRRVRDLRRAAYIDIRD